MESKSTVISATLGAAPTDHARTSSSAALSSWRTCPNVNDLKTSPASRRQRRERQHRRRRARPQPLRQVSLTLRDSAGFFKSPGGGGCVVMLAVGFGGGRVVLVGLLDSACLADLVAFAGVFVVIPDAFVEPHRVVVAADAFEFSGEAVGSSSVSDVAEQGTRSAWSVGVDRRPKCWAIEHMAMNLAVSPARISGPLSLTANSSGIVSLWGRSRGGRRVRR